MSVDVEQEDQNPFNFDDNDIIPLDEQIYGRFETDSRVLKGSIVDVTQLTRASNIKENKSA